MKLATVTLSSALLLGLQLACEPRPTIGTGTSDSDLVLDDGEPSGSCGIDIAMGAIAFDDEADPDAGPEGQPTSDAGSTTSLTIACAWPRQGPDLLGTTTVAGAYSQYAFASAKWLPLDTEPAAPHPAIDSSKVDDLGIAIMADGRRLSSAELIDLSYSPSMRIADVWPDDLRGRGRYIVEYRDSTQQWKRLCPGDDYAYALHGSVVDIGALSNKTIVTFACRQSAAAKAVRWGLGPPRFRR